MNSEEESLQLLTNLGLTVLEARVYLALSQLGKVTAKAIAKASNVSQPDTYRVLLGLENHGLVEKEVAVPNNFRATSMDEGLAILIQRRENQSAMLQAKTMELLQRFHKKGKVPVEETSKFVMIPAVYVQTTARIGIMGHRIGMLIAGPAGFLPVNLIFQQVGSEELEDTSLCERSIICPLPVRRR